MQNDFFLFTDFPLEFNDCWCEDFPSGQFFLTQNAIVTDGDIAFAVASRNNPNQKQSTIGRLVSNSISQIITNMFDMYKYKSIFESSDKINLERKAWLFTSHYLALVWYLGLLCDLLILSNTDYLYYSYR